MSNLLKTKFTLNLKLCSPLFEIVSFPEEESVGEPSEATSKAKESQHTCSSIVLTPRKHYFLCYCYYYFCCCCYCSNYYYYYFTDFIEHDRCW